MKNIIIGTAGHIDHGKTTLIKALTGRNTDRWEEEQRRGITIDLGFTYFDLPGGDRAGIIDVPGHEKFINNMVAGVVGMDLVLLVIAADEGIMPQTREHMDILNLLGIEKSIIVLNKCDLVDEEWLEMMEEDVREELSGTFLEHAPLVKVSAATGGAHLFHAGQLHTKDVRSVVHNNNNCKNNRVSRSTEYLHFPDLEQSSPEHWCPERSRKKKHFRCIRSEKNVRSEAFRFTEKIRKSVTPDNVWRSTFQM